MIRPALAAALLAFLLLVGGAGGALAVDPEERLADPALEARAERLSRELRCVVCQNQTIDDSDAPLAADLRRALRERLAAGDTDAEAVDWLVQRYGDYVLMKPPFRPLTLALWFGPGVVVLLGALGVGLYWRERSRRPQAPEQGLSPEERRRLNRLLQDEEPLP